VRPAGHTCAFMQSGRPPDRCQQASASDGAAGVVRRAMGRRAALAIAAEREHLNWALARRPPRLLVVLALSRSFGRGGGGAGLEREPHGLKTVSRGSVLQDLSPPLPVRLGAAVGVGWRWIAEEVACRESAAALTAESGVEGPAAKEHGMVRAVPAAPAGLFLQALPQLVEQLSEECCLLLRELRA
jgi:hypothetical protein